MLILTCLNKSLAESKRRTKLLAQDCKSLGINLKQVVLRDPMLAQVAGVSQRAKFRIILHFVKTTSAPVLYLEPGFRIHKNPAKLFPESIDFAGYRSNFEPLNDDSPQARAFWNAGALFFSPTPNALSFLSRLVTCAESSPKSEDDTMVLEKTWREHGINLRAFVLPHESINLNREINIPEETVYFTAAASDAVKRKKAGFKQVGTVVERHEERIIQSLISNAVKHGSPEQAYSLARSISFGKNTDPKSHLQLIKRVTSFDRPERIIQGFEDASFRDSKIHTESLSCYCDYLLDNGLHSAFLDLGNRVERLNSNSGLAVIDSYRIRYTLDISARSNGWNDEDRPKLWWMRGPYPGNFGDILTPFLVLNLYNIPIKWAPFTKASCLAIGSIAKFSRPGLKMWGCGIAHPDHQINPKADWLAVRGPETQKALAKAGGKVPDIIGDPALLLPRVYQPVVNHTGYGVIVPHYVQYRRFKQMDIKTKLESHQVRILNPIVRGFDGIKAMIDQIASADWVIASSLHGLIVAHAYGVKCCWVMPEEAAPTQPGESIKYTDYMLSVGLTTQLAVIKDNRFNLEDLVEQCRYAQTMPNLDKLEGSFPWSGLSR